MVSPPRQPVPATPTANRYHHGVSPPDGQPGECLRAAGGSSTAWSAPPRTSSRRSRGCPGGADPVRHLAVTWSARARRPAGTAVLLPRRDCMPLRAADSATIRGAAYAVLTDGPPANSSSSSQPTSTPGTARTPRPSTAWRRCTPAGEGGHRPVTQLDAAQPARGPGRGPEHMAEQRDGVEHTTPWSPPASRAAPALARLDVRYTTLQHLRPDRPAQRLGFRPPPTGASSRSGVPPALAGPRAW